MLRREKWIDAHYDLTAGNTQEAKDKPALSFFSGSLHLLQKFLQLLALLLHLKNEHMLVRGEHMGKNGHPTDIGKGSLLLWESVSLTQQNERYLIQGFGFYLKVHGFRSPSHGAEQE